MIDVFKTVARQHRITPGADYRTPPQGAQGQQTSYATLPPWQTMPAGGQPFRYINQVMPNAPAAKFLAVAGSETITVSFNVPAGRQMSCLQFINFVGSGAWIDYSGDVLWRVEIDGLCAQGFSAIPAMIGSSDQPANLRDQQLLATENQLVQLICANVAIVTAPNTNPIGGGLIGFFRPMGQIQQDLFI